MFTYNGTVRIIEVHLGERCLYVEDNQEGEFEVYSDGGGMGCFDTLGKAVTFAEKQLKNIIKNNP